jgi:predicted RNA-binding Zn ribbon-like protein
MSDRETATGDLGLVQAFVNTVDLQDGPEELSGPAELGAWLASRDLMPATEQVAASDLRNAIAVREAMRGLIGANTGASVYPVDIATLNEAAVVSRLRPRFGSDGKSRLEPEAGGVAGAMGRMVAACMRAMAADDWQRLKLCSRDACRWVFYDRSKNHSSRWCTMASCGNVEKATRFRKRSKASAEPHA